MKRKILSGLIVVVMVCSYTPVLAMTNVEGEGEITVGEGSKSTAESVDEEKNNDIISELPVGGENNVTPEAPSEDNNNNDKPIVLPSDGETDNGVEPPVVTPPIENPNNDNVVESNKLTEYQSENLNYAIEEMRIAIDILDNLDLTNIENHNRMIAFGTASLDRVRSLGITEEYSEWIYVEDIERLGNEIRNATYSLDRLLQAINNTKAIFDPERADIASNMIVVLNALDQIIEEEASNLNKLTIDSGKGISKYYWSILPASPGEPDDDNTVDIPIIPLEPSIPNEKPEDIPMTPLEPSIPNKVPMTPLNPSTSIKKPVVTTVKTTTKKAKPKVASKKATLPNTGVESSSMVVAMASILSGSALMFKRKK